MARRDATPPPPDEPVLKATKGRAKELLDRGRSEGTDLLNEAARMTSAESFEEWTHLVTVGRPNEDGAAVGV